MKCPEHYDYVDGDCYKKCPTNYKRSRDDPSDCLLNVACPVGTYIQGNSCIKNWIPPASGACPVGYQMWVLNQCYANCPEPFLEGAEKCYFPEEESALYDYHHDHDEFGNSIFQIKHIEYWVMIGILFFIILVWLLTGQRKSC